MKDWYVLLEDLTIQQKIKLAARTGLDVEVLNLAGVDCVGSHDGWLMLMLEHFNIEHVDIEPISYDEAIKLLESKQ